MAKNHNHLYENVCEICSDKLNFTEKNYTHAASDATMCQKLKNKAVLQGFPLKGEVKKGDLVKFSIGGKIYEFTALEVISSGTDPFEKSTFFDKLSSNVHLHKIPEDSKGWIIIDTEDFRSIPEGAFAAVV